MAEAKKIILTAHARLRLSERHLPNSWIETTVREPDWTEPDPGGMNVERRFRAIGELGGRILRVVCVETDEVVRVISVMFDRNARPKS